MLMLVNAESSINCQNFTEVKRPFEILLEDDFSFDTTPERIDIIVNKLSTNSEKIRYSLCNIKSTFDRDIHLAQIEADTFNNDRLEQLDGTVTSRRVGKALKHTVLKVGECVSNLAKQVLLVPLRVEPEIPCVSKEILLLKNYSTEIANIITNALKAIVHYPMHIILCFQREQKTNCLSKIYKNVIKSTITDIMNVVDKSVEIDEMLQSSTFNLDAKPSSCSEFSTTISKLAMIPLNLLYCIQNKIY